MAAQAEGWAKEDKRRMLHAVYRVGDMDATVEYYKKHFGMQVRLSLTLSCFIGSRIPYDR